MLILISFTFASCSFTPAPEKALAKLLDHLIKGQFTKAEKYTYEGTIGVSDKNTNAKKLYKTIFRSISYTISDSVVSQDSAEVTVTITMIDMESIVAQASLEALEGSFTGFGGGNKKFYNLVKAKVESPEVTYTTNTVTVYMVKDENDSWVVVMGSSSSFADAITGGVGELIGY